MRNGQVFTAFSATLRPLTHNASRLGEGGGNNCTALQPKHFSPRLRQTARCRQAFRLIYSYSDISILQCYRMYFSSSIKLQIIEKSIP